MRRSERYQIDEKGNKILKGTTRKVLGFLVEWHSKECSCSYCHSTTDYPKLHYGLNIPSNWKALNSWYVIKYWPGCYIRWTNSWLKRPTFRR